MIEGNSFQSKIQPENDQVAAPHVLPSVFFSTDKSLLLFLASSFIQWPVWKQVDSFAINASFFVVVKNDGSSN